ncbi:uncharacterized protein LOC126834339 [Adelges cooleyi]|uniref:uncharacterized protein LOC126834339 n=1 Tax=Adelges cooleyi TaxID=133065 RepID=UPI0021805054|nr:uncharacterized protein LOC126834339 [Adelges cooleyi]
MNNIKTSQMDTKMSLISLSSKSLANILELITMTTGIEEFSEVYLKYVQIINTLQDNSYEYPKKRAVEELVEGILEKYIAHGFPLEAKEFEMRVYWFINNSDINNRLKHSSSAVKWAIINMIIEMARNPCGFRNALRNTNLDSVRIQLEGETAVLGETWKANLVKELLDIGRRDQQYAESSNNDDTDYEDECDYKSLSLASSWTTCTKDETVTKTKGFEDNRRQYLKLLYLNENKALKVLKTIKSNSWWYYDSDVIVKGGKDAPHFALKRYSNSTSFKVIDDKKVILECLKHHLVPSNIFQHSLEDQNRLFGYITILPSVSPEIFNSWTTAISPFINKFSDLLQFTHHMKCVVKIPYTLRAYAKGLEKILEPIINTMQLIENQIKNLCYPNRTIMSFEEDMQKHLQVISFVHSIHTKAFISNWEKLDSWMTCIRLISVLFWSVQKALLDYEKLISMTLFVYTFEPYIHMTELWIHAGQLVDEHNEFVILKYEGDSCTEFNLYFKDIIGYLENCGLQLPPIIENLMYLLSKSDWKVFVASEISNDDKTLGDVPRGELFHNFLLELRTILNDWDDYIIPFDSYNPSIWNRIPMLATSCVNYKFFANFTFNLTSLLSYEIVDIFVLVVQKVLDNIGMKVRDIILKDNKCVHHLKTLYNIIFLEDMTKTVTIDRETEYKIERNSFLNNCFYSLISDDHSSVLSTSDHSCNLSLNYKTGKHSLCGDDFIFNDNFADELERINITYDVKFPLSLILTNEVISKYNKMFHLLITVKQAVEMISQLQTKDLKKYNDSLDVKRMYFIRLWILSTTYKLKTYLFSVASKYLGTKLFDNFEKVKNGLEAFETVLEAHVCQAIKMCMLDGLMEKLSYQALALLWNACEQFTKLWKNSALKDSIDIEMMETIEQEYVNSCWKLANGLDTYLVAEDDTSSLLYQFCQDFMSSMPTKESTDLDGSLVYKLSDSQNRYSFIYT